MGFSGGSTANRGAPLPGGVTAGGPLRGISGLPMGAGPQIATITVDGGSATGGKHGGKKVGEQGVIDVAEVTVFHLGASSSGESGLGDDVGGIPVVCVAGLDSVGSEILARALAEGSLPGVLEALAFDVVLLPVLVSDEGQLDTRVFDTGDGSLSICVFSSAAVLEGFLGDDEVRARAVGSFGGVSSGGVVDGVDERQRGAPHHLNPRPDPQHPTAQPQSLFVMIHGAAVVEYVVAHRDRIVSMVCDPGRSASMSITSDELAGFLAADDTAPPEDPAGLSPANAPVGEVKGFDLGLNSQWGVVDLKDENRWAQIDRLVERQTRRLADNQVLIRRDMGKWLAATARHAEQNEGIQLGFLLARTRDTAAALSVVTYCHFLGGHVDGVSHVERITEHLASRRGENEDLVRITTPGGLILRHTRMRHGDERLGAASVPLLLIDYWLDGPDGKNVSHVSFSSPHVDARTGILHLADNVVLNGEWIVAESRAGEGV